MHLAYLYYTQYTCTLTNLNVEVHLAVLPPRKKAIAAYSLSKYAGVKLTWM